MTITEDRPTTVDPRSDAVRIGFASGKDLARVLSNALLSAGKDKARPVLCSLLFEQEDNDVKVVATDSYRLSWETLEQLDGTCPTFAPFLVDRSDADAVAKMLKSSPGPVTFYVSPDRLEVRAGGQTYGCRLLTGDQFPNYRQLISDDEGYVSEVGFNPKYLADFAKVKPADAGAPMRLQFVDNLKPARVTIGSYHALLMPFRLS